MKRFIKIYNDHNEVVEAVDNNELYIPYVAWLETPQIIDWNSYSGGPFVPSGGYATYLTFTSMADDNTVSFSVGANLRPNQATRMELSTDSGATWSGITIDGENDQTLSVTVNSGDTVWWRGTANRWNANGTSSPARFNATKNYMVSGNILSILYGSEFRGQKEIPNPYDWNNRFFAMFSGSTTLIDASELLMPEGIIYNGCCERMFYNCTNLEAAPDLPATTLIGSAYASMFQGCTSLTDMPTIGATRVSDSWSFSRMFQDCTGLTGATNMSVTGVNGSEYAFEYMFLNCRSLLNAPTLPATNLSSTTGCYYGMFKDCTSLSAAPALPATTLADSCYESMFQNCSGITSAPELSATTLADYSYKLMFCGCSALTSITCLATDITATNCTDNWVNDVASAGTFTKTSAMTSWLVDSVNGIPSGWTVRNYEDPEPTPTPTPEPSGYSSMYFTTRSLSDNNTITFSGNSTCYYSTDGTNWTHGNSVTLNSGETAIWKDTTTSQCGCTFTSTADFDVEGNSMSLLYGDGFTGHTTLESENTFRRLLHSARVINAENLILPATSLTKNCYSYMFGGCSGLTSIPAIPATTYANYSCQFMFAGCSGLTDLSDIVISADTFATSACAYMFSYCQNLTDAPQLPSTNLSSACYDNMFEECTSLVNAPHLPATTLAERCYAGMFEGCTSLVNPPVISAMTLASGCCASMFIRCTSLTSSPVLKASTLATYCYTSMFQGCSALTSITCLATDISAYYSTNFMTLDVASNGTFTKSANMSGWETGSSGIPSGWNVQDYSE